MKCLKRIDNIYLKRTIFSNIVRIMRKYKNRKAELEIQQKQEIILSENKNLLKASKFI